jgi:hypothetical protein
MCGGNGALHTSKINGINERVVVLLSGPRRKDYRVGPAGGRSQCWWRDRCDITERGSSAKLLHQSDLLTPAT